MRASNASDPHPHPLLGLSASRKDPPILGSPTKSVLTKPVVPHLKLRGGSEIEVQYNPPEKWETKALLEVYTARASKEAMEADAADDPFLRARSPPSSRPASRPASSSGARSGTPGGMQPLRRRVEEKRRRRTWDRPKLYSHLEIGAEELEVLQDVYAGFEGRRREERREAAAAVAAARAAAAGRRVEATVREEENWEEEDAGLDEEEFVELFSTFLHLSTDALAHMFQKIDSNSDGRVQWKEFVGYVHTESARLADARRGKGRYTLGTRNVLVGEHHRNLVDRIVMLDRGHTQLYLTLGRDDVVELWDPRTLAPVADLPRPRATYLVRPDSHLEPVPRRWATDGEVPMRAPVPELPPSSAFRSPRPPPRPVKEERAHSSSSSGSGSGSEGEGERKRAGSEGGARIGVPATRAAVIARMPFRAHWDGVLRGEAPDPRLAGGPGPPPTWPTFSPLTERYRPLFAHAYQPLAPDPFVRSDQLPANTIEVHRLGDGQEAGPAGQQLPPGSHVKKLSRYSARSACWATDAAWFRPAARLFVSSMDRHVYAYETRRGALVAPETGCIKRHGPVLCLNADADPLGGRPLLYLGDATGAVAAYDPETCELVQTHGFHTEGVIRTGVCFGTRLVSAGLDGRLVLVDADRWNLVWDVAAHRRGIAAFTHSPDFRLLVTAGMDRTVALWDPFLQRVVTRMPQRGASVVDVAVADRYSLLVAAYADKTLAVWDLRTMRCVQTALDRMVQTPQDELSAILFDPLNTRLVTAGSTLRSWPLANDRGAHEAPAPSTAQVAAAETALETARRRRASVIAGQAGPVAAVAEANAQAERRRARRGSVLDTRIAAADGAAGRAQAHTCRVVAVLHSAQYRQLSTVAVNGSVRVWNFSSGQATLAFVASHRTALTAACLDRLQRRLLTASQDGALKVWNAHNGEPLHSYAPRPSPVTTIAYMSIGTVAELPVLVAGWDGLCAMLPDPAEGEKRRRSQELPGHEGDVLAVAAQGTLVADGGADGCVHLWKTGLNQPQRLARTQVPAGPEGIPAIEQLLFVRGGRGLVAATEDGDVHLLSGATGRIVAARAARTGPGPLLDADGRSVYLAAGDADGRLFVWAISEAGVLSGSSPFTPLHAAQPFHAPVSALAVVRDRPVAVAGSARGEVLLFGLAEGAELARVAEGSAWPALLPSYPAPEPPPPPPPRSRPAVDVAGRAPEEEEGEGEEYDPEGERGLPIGDDDPLWEIVTPRTVQLWEEAAPGDPAPSAPSASRKSLADPHAQLLDQIRTRRGFSRKLMRAFKLGGASFGGGGREGEGPLAGAPSVSSFHFHPSDPDEEEADPDEAPRRRPAPRAPRPRAGRRSPRHGHAPGGRRAPLSAHGAGRASFDGGGRRARAARAAWGRRHRAGGAACGPPRAAAAAETLRAEGWQRGPATKSILRQGAKEGAGHAHGPGAAPSKRLTIDART
eukprot:tig00020537_g10243.t1